MRPAGDNGYAAGERTLWILCRALRASCARVLCSVGRPPPRALSSAGRARHDTRNQRSLAPSRARGASVPDAVRPSLCVCVCVNEISCDSQDHALAPHEGDYPGEVSCCGTALIPHLEEEVGSKRMNLVKIEEEGLEHRRSRICNVTSLLGRLRNRIDEENMHPGAKTPQYSDKSSTTSFDARARGHRRGNGREFCSCTTFENKSGSPCTKIFFCGACE